VTWAVRRAAGGATRWRVATWVGRGVRERRRRGGQRRGEAGSSCVAWLAGSSVRRTAAEAVMASSGFFLVPTLNSAPARRAVEVGLGPAMELDAEDGAGRA
jgi:hypothetical protein